MKKTNFYIKEYSDEYLDQIRDVIGKTLTDISVIDRNTLPIDDADLGKIDEIYSDKGRFWVALHNNQKNGFFP